MKSKFLTNENRFKKTKFFPEKKFVLIETEKRNMQRFDLELPTCLIMNNRNRKQESVELRTHNVSPGGAFVKTDEPLPIGTKVDVRMILSLERSKKNKMKKSRIDVSGSVIRTDEEGMAICFDEKYTISPYNI